jgi:hypothetical protein
MAFHNFHLLGPLINKKLPIVQCTLYTSQKVWPNLQCRMAEGGWRGIDEVWELCSDDDEGNKQLINSNGLMVKNESLISVSWIFYP